LSALKGKGDKKENFAANDRMWGGQRRFQEGRGNGGKKRNMSEKRGGEKKIS